MKRCYLCDVETVASVSEAGLTVCDLCKARHGLCASVPAAGSLPFRPLRLRVSDLQLPSALLRERCEGIFDGLKFARDGKPIEFSEETRREMVDRAVELVIAKLPPVEVPLVSTKVSADNPKRMELTYSLSPVGDYAPDVEAWFLPPSGGWFSETLPDPEND